MEAHFVFSADSDLAVIGVMLTADGEDNSFLSHFWNHFDNAEHELEGGELHAHGQGTLLTCWNP